MTKMIPQEFGFAVLTALMALTGCVRVSEKSAPIPESVVFTTDELDEEGDPEDAEADEPEWDYYVRLKTTNGEMLLGVSETWSPNAAKRFRELIEKDFYDNTPFHRMLNGQYNRVAQFGINLDPKVNAKEKRIGIVDEKRVADNDRGTLSMTMSYRGDQPVANSRSTQVFINQSDNPMYDKYNFVPFAKVLKGIDVMDSLEDKYGESPRQNLIESQGKTYLENYPDLDYIIDAVIIEKEEYEKNSGEEDDQASGESSDAGDSEGAGGSAAGKDAS